MSTLQDTGNAVNIANFQNLISYCSNFGEAYNPSRDALKLGQLQALLAEAKSIMLVIHDLTTEHDDAVNHRKKLFADLRPLSTKVCGAFSICGVEDAVVEDAKGINRKIQGQRASAKPEPVMVDGVLTTPKTNSSSQQSFDYMIEHLNALISLVSFHSAYNPNETDLKVTTLKALATDLNNANNAVINSHTPLDIARGNRNTLLYAPKTGLVDIALDVKTYIKVTFGTGSMEYGKVKGILFKRIV
ncbi:hypothetical protein ABID42_002155 [Arcicella rosea]|uniref:hypothetical protein n=1 Tax=Arcicella rosea TaxID=502909 RepID=UPI00345DEE9A